jgi:hypothetical protein
MKFVWDEAKRRVNLQKHGMDFADAWRVFDGPMALFEDDRDRYGERRMVGVGLLDALVVLVVHVEQDESIRIISMRKADRNEANIYYSEIGL